MTNKRKLIDALDRAAGRAKDAAEGAASPMERQRLLRLHNSLTAEVNSLRREVWDVPAVAALGLQAQAV